MVYPHVLWYIWGTNLLQTKYVITSQSLYHILFIELVFDDFLICKIQGESPHDYNLLKYHIALFSFMSFSSQGFSYKVFNETISI